MARETKPAVLVAYNQFFMNGGIRIVAGPASHCSIEEAYPSVDQVHGPQVRFSAPVGPYGFVMHADRMAVAVIPEKAFFVRPRSGHDRRGRGVGPVVARYAVLRHGVDLLR